MFPRTACLLLRLAQLTNGSLQMFCSENSDMVHGLLAEPRLIA